MLKLLTKIFGTKSDKDIKLIKPIVENINEHYEQLHSLSNNEIKAKTDEFRGRINEATKNLENEKQELIEKLKNEALEAVESQDVHDKIKKLDDDIFHTVEETLDEILPEVFAVVKQACKRLKDQQYSYEYAGQRYVWDMIPYDVQLIGGIVIHQGKIAEMATGEGKTLVAIMPMYLNALAGKGVHLVTVNDYLAKRDCDWMRPVYEFLGMKVDAIQSNMDHQDRKRIYNCDITYGTNNEFGFDYLRDNMVVDADHMVQRPHWFAIVDEVDSVLIDEARTPLIISGPVPQSEQRFDEMNSRVRKLVDAQSRLVTKLTSEASELLKSDTKEDKEKAGIKLLSAYRGLPKHKRLAKLLQNPDVMKLKHETELVYLADQGRKMQEIDEGLYYVIEEKNHSIDITEKGRELLTSASEDPDMFVIPDITTEMSQMEVDESLTAEEKQTKVDKLNLIYAERSDRIHTVTQLLRSYSLYEKDVDYVVQDGKVMIVDEFTGRILDGRRYSEGLHQAIEAKENVKVEKDTQTFATITLQNYFRLYNKLAGMTGTAETEAAEFEKIYNMEVVVIPTNRPIVRKDEDDLIFRTMREKYNAIIEEIESELNNERAVLVGTASVEVSEVLSKMLHRKKIRHNVLNAKHHEREADIISHAGKKGAVTIATNMAGRGTDIKLDPRVKQNGGLAIIGTERHDARRIDRQLRGRSGRQGDPGSSRFFISLEDKLMRLFSGDRIASVMQSLKIPEGEAIQHPIITKSVENAQKKVEENNFSIRKRLLDYDNVMNQQREVIYTRRKNALSGERMRGEIFEFIYETASEWIEEHKQANDLEGLKSQVRANFLSDPAISEEEFTNMKDEEILERILSAAKEFYDRKEEMLGIEFMARLERVAILQTIDDKWREHLRVMDDVKEGIHLRSYGQKDPLLEYKGEAYKMFIELIKDINKAATQFAFKYFPQVIEKRKNTGSGKREEDDDGIPKLRRSRATSNLQYEKSDNAPAFVRGGGQVPKQREEVSTVKTERRTKPKIGRNDPCYCGSGKKYKHCHEKIDKGMD